MTLKHHRTKRTIAEEARFLAREIQDDVMAKEDEIAIAIEAALVRYAETRYLTSSQRGARAMGVPPLPTQRPYIERR